MYFFNRRPRGFHYTMRFSNERRDLIDNLRRGVPPDVLAQHSLEEEAQHASRGRSRRHGRGLFLMIGVMIVVILAFLLAVILIKL